LGLGYFGTEDYDFHNPLANTSLNEVVYKKARKEFEEMNFSHWYTVDELVLCLINDDFTKTEDLMSFQIGLNN